MAFTLFDFWTALGFAFPTLAAAAPVALALLAFLRNVIPSEESFEQNEKLIVETLIQRLCDGHREVIVWTVNYTCRPGALEPLDLAPQPATRLSQEMIRTVRALSRLASLGNKIRELHARMLTCLIAAILSIAIGAFFVSARPVGSAIILMGVGAEVWVVIQARKLRADINAEHGRA